MRVAMPDETVNAVIERHAREIVSLPGVVGMAEGEANGAPCIRVFVVRKTKHLLGSIPQSLDGWPVTVQETGEFTALKESDGSPDGKVD
jgi:hypothetical protein